jgi:hypothetical protein
LRYHQEVKNLPCILGEVRLAMSKHFGGESLQFPIRDFPYLNVILRSKATKDPVFLRRITGYLAKLLRFAFMTKR